MVQQVMESSESLENELTDRGGSRYQLRIRLTARRTIRLMVR